jgi:hypothetical protein
MTGCTYLHDAAVGHERQLALEREPSGGEQVTGRRPHGPIHRRPRDLPPEPAALRGAALRASRGYTFWQGEGLVIRGEPLLQQLRRVGPTTSPSRSLAATTSVGDHSAAPPDGPRAHGRRRRASQTPALVVAAAMDCKDGVCACKPKPPPSSPSRPTLSRASSAPASCLCGAPCVGGRGMGRAREVGSGGCGPGPRRKCGGQGACGRAGCPGRERRGDEP